MFAAISRSPPASSAGSTMTEVSVAPQRAPEADTEWNSVIEGYFERCFRDYRMGWSDRRSLGMHMGYWDAHTKNHAHSLINMNQQMARRCSIRSGLKVLDAGCGVGGTAVWLAKSFGVDVTGITLPPSHVVRAQRTAERRAVANRARFLRMDFHRTAFADETFDIVWAQEAVAHSPTKETFFREAFRVLKPGGRLVMEEGLRRSRPYAAEDERLLNEWLCGWAVPDLATGDEYVSWAETAGFEMVKLDDITDHVVPSLQRLYRLSSVAYPLAVLRHPLRRLASLGVVSAGGIPAEAPLTVDRRLRNWRGGRYQWEAMRRGLWFLGILSARKPSTEDATAGVGRA